MSTFKAKDTRIVYSGERQLAITGKWETMFNVVLHHDRKHVLYGPSNWKDCIRWRKKHLE